MAPDRGPCRRGGACQIVEEIVSSCLAALEGSSKERVLPEEDAAKPRATPPVRSRPFRGDLVSGKSHPTEHGAAIARQTPRTPAKEPRQDTRANPDGLRDAVSRSLKQTTETKLSRRRTTGPRGEERPGAPSSCGGMRPSPMAPTESFGVHSPTLGSGSGGGVSPAGAGQRGVLASEIAAGTHTRRARRGSTGT